MKSLFLVGYGYVADHVVNSSGNYFNSVNLVSRNPSDRVGSWQNISEFAVPGETSHILITVPPHKGESILCDMVRKSTDSLKNLEWVGYLSATSVYGNHNGDWVNEESETKTQTISGKARLDSEGLWCDVFGINKLNIFRLAGIYGEGRSTIDRIQAGKIFNIKKKGHYFSRIHIDDLVLILYKSALNKDKGEIYNLSDNEPSSLHEVIEYCAKMMSVEIPVAKNIHDTEVSERMKEFFLENKKIDNTKVKNELNYKLQFPSYREGLKDIWKKYCDR